MKTVVRQVTYPVAEPISVTEAKSHCRVTTDADDADIAALIVAAREAAEATINRAIVSRTFEILLDCFPNKGYGSYATYSSAARCTNRIDLPNSPVRSVVSVKYTDLSGVEQTLSAANYQLDKYDEPARLVPAYGLTWPDTRDQLNAVRIRYVSGMAVPFTADVSNNVLSAIGHGYAVDDEVPVLSAGGAPPAGIVDGGLYYAKAPAADTLQLAASAGGAAIDLTDTPAGSSFLGNIPKSIRQAMLMMIAHWYDNRAPVADVQTFEVPMTADRLLMPHVLLPL